MGRDRQKDILKEIDEELDRQIDRKKEIKYRKTEKDRQKRNKREINRLAAAIILDYQKTIDIFSLPLTF